MTMESRYAPGKYPRISPCGESALLVEFAPVISAVVNDRVHALAKNLAEDPVPGLVETVPAYGSLLVYFDLRRIRFRRLQGLIRRRITQSTEGSAPARTLFFIPVCYEGAFAEDLGEVVSHTGLSPGEILRRHTAPRYRIFMLGFLPGFPYLGGLDPRLETPRRKTPRTAVPRGAVGIGGNQTGIYPLASPGGWQLIGRTPIRPYDSRREEPVLYKTGDFIAFFPIDPGEYAETEKQVEAGVYEVRREAYSPPPEEGPPWE
ncbi:MAG: 5-oxoprolinase subunit PxpB [Spirochaetaceae bacterium]|jgi:KipI family sensor histidine kinase inhibitor|nr:5-oxoprolinase subunit PxpB [Spirochaetaceae bacterium]